MENADLERIEKYFRQELTEAERAAFEQKLATDEAFRQEVALHERALTAIRFDSLWDLKSEFQQREAALRRQKSIARKRWLAALLLSLFFAGGWWFWKRSSEKTPPVPQTQTTPPAQDTLEKQETSPPDTAQILPPGKPAQKNDPPKSPAKRKPDPEKLFADAFQPYH
ncbi:MAG: hypothetical protein AAB316_01185, partial [Bacteroidota bacterium]